jgi:hypothetical protein
MRDFIVHRARVRFFYIWGQLAVINGKIMSSSIRCKETLQRKYTNNI